MNKGTACAILVILMTIALGIITTSCSPKLEKVVIIDSTTTSYPTSTVTSTHYKVNRIEYGVVDYVHEIGVARYEQGDTIYHHFD